MYGVKREDEWASQVRVDSETLVVFTRQFLSLLQSGIQIVGALDALEQNPENLDFGRVIAAMRTRISGGSRLSHAMSSFPRVFPRIYLTMVRIGEETGRLEDCLKNLVDWLEGDQAVVRRVKSALSYPCFIVALTATLTLGLFYGVMPTFVEIFQGMHIPLPLPTRILLFLTQALRQPFAWLVILSGFYALWRGTHYVLARPSLVEKFYLALLRVPLVGKILLLSSIARYAAAMSATMGAGLSLTSALSLAAEASGSPLIQGDAAGALHTVKEGLLASEHMRLRPHIYPSTLCHMLSAGEESSRIPEMLDNSAKFSTLELESRIDELSAALEPIMLMAVSFAVGSIVLAIFLPLYSFIGQLGS